MQKKIEFKDNDWKSKNSGYQREPEMVKTGIENVLKMVHESFN